MKTLIKKAIETNCIILTAETEGEGITADIDGSEAWIPLPDELNESLLEEYISSHKDEIVELIDEEIQHTQKKNPTLFRYIRDYLISHTLTDMDDDEALRMIREAYNMQVPQKYKFQISIGDWTGDGHCMEQSYLVVSNKPVEAVRDAHFNMESVTGINIEDLCSHYEEDTIDEETVEILKEMGFHFENPSGMGENLIYPKEMARLWLFLLMKTDPELKLELKTLPEEISTLHFYGYDRNGRHIRCVGYGLFH